MNNIRTDLNPSDNPTLYHTYTKNVNVRYWITAGLGGTKNAPQINSNHIGRPAPQFIP